MEISNKNEILRLIKIKSDQLPIVLESNITFLYDIIGESPFSREAIIEEIKKYPNIYDQQIGYIEKNLFKENNINKSSNYIKFLSDQGINTKEYLKVAIDKYFNKNPGLFISLARISNNLELIVDKIMLLADTKPEYIDINTISNIIEYLSKEQAEKLVRTYLDRCNDIDIDDFTDLYYILNGSKEIFDIIISKYVSTNDMQKLTKFLRDSIECNIDIKPYINNKYFTKVLNDNVRSDYIFDLGNILSKYIPNEIDMIFTKRKDFLINKLANLLISYPVNGPKKSAGIISSLLSELLDHENVKLQDITILEHGGTANIISIGDLIFKIGMARETFKIPNSKYILQPIIRREFQEYKGLTIEIEDKVDTEDITEEDVQQLYNNLRDEGLYWVDVKARNVGRLLKPNKPEYMLRTGRIEQSEVSTGLIDEVDTLDKGELVVIDSDFIYTKDNLDPEVLIDSSFYDYESRYLNSKKSNKTR